MKIRNGFVSNSSSSSFIVVMKRENIPTTEEAILETLEGGETWDERSIDDEMRARIVWRDIMDQLETAPIVESDLRTRGARLIDTEFHSGWMAEEVATPAEKAELQRIDRSGYGIYKIEDEDKRSAAFRKHWEEEEVLRKKIVNKFVRKFVDKHIGKTVLRFEYSDHNGESALEHGGDTWNWAKNNGAEVVSISHH